ncbi:MAG: NUDIX hydrolase [Methyloligellaceae bacterium]
MSGTSAIPIFPIPGVSAAIFRDGRVLLVKRAKGRLRDLWSLPGGHIEPGEPALDAIHREIFEEAHIEAEIIGLVDVFDVILHNQAGQLAAHYVLNVFYGVWRSGEAEAGSDSAAVKWVFPSEITGLSVTDGLVGIVNQASERLKDRSQ